MTFKNFLLTLLAVSVLCSVGTVMLQAQNSDVDRVRSSTHSSTQLNSQLFEALRQHQNARPHDSAALLHLQAVAAKRGQELRTLMSSNPAAVLAAAVPDDVRNAFPSDLRDLIEQHVRLEGEMEIAIEDGADYSRIHYGLLVAGQRLKLHFADEPPADLITGTAVQVEGVRAGDDLALTSSGTTTTTKAVMTMSASATTNTTITTTTSILPNTFGAQKTLVILVNFQDEATQPVTTSFVSGLMFSDASSVSNWWLENSFQQTWATGDVAGWYTIPVSYNTCDTSSIASYGNTAAQNAGYVLSNYQHRVYIFPNNACTWWGYSTIGGAPSQSWIRDYNNSSSGVALMNLTHELGHSLGLYHSHGWNCSAYPNTGCTSNEYGDSLDVMGNIDYVTAPHYNGFQKERLGWLNYSAQPPIQSVGATGTYTLAPYESQDKGVKALKILQSNGAYYYVEYRAAAGFDSFLSGNSNVLNGVILRLATPGNPDSGELLNIPSPGSDNLTPGLEVGQTYIDSTTGLTITPAAVGASATVQVSLGAPATCARANPTISMVGPSSSVAPGATSNFSVTVTNNDSSACNASLFSLGYSVPSGWTAVYASSSVSLSPGASGSATLQVTAPSGTPNGTYTSGSSAANMSVTGFTAATSATETVYTPGPVTVAVTTSKSIYTGGQKILASVTVMSGTVPAIGASTTVKITKSNGSTVTLNGTTGSNGIVTVSYQSKKNDPKGAWQVVASSGNASASTSFTVE